VITLSGRFQSIVLLIAGAFMVIMGINMLGLFPALRRITPRLPGSIGNILKGQHAGKGPLIIGFLNGFMPCGPLQAMQLYALSTGSPIRGGISMFLFCLGTIPLMFSLGAAGGALSGVKGRAFSRRAMQVGAVFVAAMGLVMVSNGWNGADFRLAVSKPPSLTPVGGTVERQGAEGGFAGPTIQDGVQIVNSTLTGNRYPAITVVQGVPVRWTITAAPGSITGCNNRFRIPEYGIQYTFRPGENVIEFFPEKAGRFRYSCWMSMIHSTITVIAEGEITAVEETPNSTPIPAGVKIPTDTIALAQNMGNFQMVEVRLGDNGFEPAVIVMQQMLPTYWVINNDSLKPGNNSMILPAYYTIAEIGYGDNAFQVIPTEDFDFSTGDNKFYGYVKVVDDINQVDVNAVKAEVSNFKTLVYPPAHFDFDAAAGGGCCQ
jgi:plastocyanin domain-containing protein